MAQKSILEKLAILSDAAKYDASCASSSAPRRSSADGKGLGSTEGMGICHSYAPDGRCISLLKILMTNFCIFDCAYCINRVSSNVTRARFSVEEIVWLTLEFYRRNYIEGLFLSSGIIRSPDDTMSEMVRAAKVLRLDHGFKGYIHLKTIPDAAQELIDEAGLYADRLSANIELPTQADLNSLAPAKSHAETEESMNHIKLSILESIEERTKSRRAPLYAPGGQSTQMIVGATPTNDRDIMLKASQLYTQQNLKRVYYSAFSPIPDSDPNLPPKSPPLIREHRLYQTDWLIRLYGFDIQEILPSDQPTLDLDKDPKLSWALRNRAFFPVDINTAPREILLRVPGLGATLVERIISSRRHRMIRFADIANLPSMKKAKFFITTVDNLFDAKAIDSLGLEATILKKNSQQLDLFTYATAIA